QGKVKTGEIDQDRRRWWLGLDTIGQPPEYFEEERELGYCSQWPHDGGVANVSFHLDACFPHALTAQPENPATRKPAEERAGDVRAIHVTGCFSGDHQKCFRFHGFVGWSEIVAGTSRRISVSLHTYS